MMKERAIAIFFGVIMVASAAGFALSGVTWWDGAVENPADVPAVSDRALTREEFRSVLMSGKTVIQNHYPVGCEGCGATNALLENFAKDMGGFVVLEEFGVQFQNESVLQIVSSDGRITELDGAALNQSGLLDALCDVSYVQPKKCILRGIGTAAANASI